VAIAGHRSTFGAWFRHVRPRQAGRPIKLQMRVWRVHLSRRGHGIVVVSALWISRTVGHDRLVVSACRPLSSASKRIVTFARLTTTTASSQLVSGYT
jgi:sortase A